MTLPRPGNARATSAAAITDRKLLEHRSPERSDHGMAKISNPFQSHAKNASTGPLPALVLRRHELHGDAAGEYARPRALYMARKLRKTRDEQI